MPVASSDSNLRFVRIQLHQVVDVDQIIASTCLGGLRRSTVYAELRLHGQGVSYTPSFRTTPIAAHGGRWENEIMDLRLTEQDMYTRVLGISLYAVDLLGLSVCLGDAKVPLTPFELLKHQITISDDIHLTEDWHDASYEEVTTCRVQVSVAVWTCDDVNHSTTLEVWEHERFARTSWSSSHLLATDRHVYACGSVTSDKWSDVEPEVPREYVEVLGWAADKSQGDESGWFYASSFAGPWHNEAGHAFPCRRRRLVKLALLASVQTQKQVQFELLQLDHTQLVREFQDVQLLVQAKARELQLQELAHTNELGHVRSAHKKAMQEAQDNFETQLAIAKAVQQDLHVKVVALQTQLRQATVEAPPLATVTQPSKPASTTCLVRVQLHRAANLVAADSVFMGGKSDPYVLFSIGNVQQKSSMHRSTLDPVWHNEIFDFDLTRRTPAVLLVHVFDFDQFSADELIGSVSIPLHEVEETNDPDEARTFGLTIPPKFATKKPSTVTLQFEFGSWIDDDDDDTNHETDGAKSHDGPVQLVMWENERHHRGHWGAANLKATDRQAWSVGATSAAAREAIAPKIPLGMESHLGWAVDRRHGDPNGWFYAASFDGPWMNGPHASAVVRRRKWTQRCTRRRQKSRQVLSSPDDPHLHATAA
ncbi:hypothetical protein DYB35_002004 [Aphanomyces astaci]|uniref:C2 domain-containing protein n=1 Tax=Aphanomyces astaci TaxID=112090 RepID=A0A3R6X968_APHAT|nr:hypothetical protein DYB35_002004 [Aphanomyces astaci]